VEVEEFSAGKPGAVRSGRFVASVLLEPGGDAPFEAELAVRSLIRNGEVAADDIVIHASSDLGTALTAPFVRAGCTVNIVGREAGPHVDGGFVRHLALLARADLGDALGAWLCSPGVAVTAALSQPSHFSGKLVGRSAVSPELFERVFREAVVALPTRAPCDESAEWAVLTQLDTGLVYIPRTLLAELDIVCRRFAALVRAIPAVATAEDSDRQIEELSLALALAASGTPIAYLTANDLFALDNRSWPHSYDARKRVRAVRRLQLDRIRARLVLPA